MRALGREGEALQKGRTFKRTFALVAMLPVQGGS